MPLYESVFIARQDCAVNQVEGMAGSFADIIKNQGGKVTKTEHWGLRTLAYKIKKNKKGHYVLMNIDAPAKAVIELERNMRINEDLLRFMTIKVEALEEGPSAIMRKSDREERFDRGDRGGFDRPRAPRSEGRGEGRTEGRGDGMRRPRREASEGEE